MALMLGAVVVALTLAFIRYTQDDVFITYTYSRNLVEGLGFVFNPGEPVQGTTTPLWTLVMAGVYALTPDLLTAGNVLSAALLLLSIALSWHLVDGLIARPVQIGLALMMAAAPLYYISLGMETLLYTALLTGALLLWRADRRRAALVLSGLLTLTRADGLVLAGIFGLLLLNEALHQRTRAAWGRFFGGALIGLLTIAPWFTFAYSYFGSLTPNTLSAKAQPFSGLDYLSEGWLLLDAMYSPLGLIGLGLAGLGMGRALHSLPTLRPLALWVAAYTLGYTVLNTTEFWYYTPLLTGLLILAAVGADGLLRNRPAVRWGLFALTLLYISLGVVQGLRWSQPPQRTEVYRALGQWIERETPPDSTLLLADLGIVGYYARRHAVDSFGLIVPDMHSFIPTYAALKYRPDYAVTTNYPPWYDTLQDETFHAVYRPLLQTPVLLDPAFSPAAIYQRRLPLETPRARYRGQPLGLNCTLTVPEGGRLPRWVTGTLTTADGTVRYQQEQRPMLGSYPARGRRVLGAERLYEQISLPTGALKPGRYTWTMDCGTGEPVGAAVTLNPLEAAPGYQAITDALWADGVRLAGVWLPDGTDLFKGGTLRLLLAIEGEAPLDAVVWLGVELIDTAGEKRAEGIILLPEPPVDAALSESVAAYGEIRLPVVMPDGPYRVEVNRFVSGVWQRVPLADGQRVYALPDSLTVRAWAGD